MNRKWHIPRRTFLGGAGSLLALPLLEQMIPGGSRAHAATPPAGRMVVIHWPTGVCPGVFQPTAANGQPLTASNVGAVLSPLATANLIGDTTIVTNLKNQPAYANQAGDHARGTGAFLTCTLPPNSISPLKDGVSMDVVAATALGTGMRMPGGLFLGTNGGGGAGNDCDSGYSCAYEFNSSWGPNSTPVPEEDNPLNAFNRVFAGFDPGATQAQIQQRLKNKKSILDYSLAQSQSLMGKLNPRDAAKVDQYMSGIRDMETSLQATMTAPSCTPGTAPPSGIPSDIRQHVQLMLDLTVMTLSCDITPVVTFSYENTVSERQHSFLTTDSGQTVTDGWHIGITHGASAGSAFCTAEYKAINTWMYSQVAYLVGKLKSVVQPDGSTLLDRTIVYSGTELGIGGNHDHDHLRLAVCGGKALGLTPGRHIIAPDPTPLSNLYLSFLQKLQVPNATSFGDSNGTIAI